MRDRIVVAHNQSSVSLMFRREYHDGTHSFHAIEAEEYDLAGAMELAADVLKAAGGMLQMQASALRAQAANERRRSTRARDRVKGAKGRADAP